MPVEWPIFLQEFINAAGFSMAIGDTVLRTEMDVGPAKLRRRFTHSIDDYQTAITVYQDTMDSFMNFFKTSLNGGVTPFYFIDPIFGTEQVFRFVGTPKVVPNGTAGWFDISMTWEKIE
jgi:hypothetical protein